MGSVNDFAAVLPGAWKLFIEDDAAGDSGKLTGGWSLDIKTDAPPPASGSGAGAGTGSGGDAGQPETPPSGSGGQAVDLQLRAKRKQDPRKLAITAGCGTQACSVDATGVAVAKTPGGKGGKAAIATKRFPLKPASVQIAANATEKIRLKIKGKRKLAQLLDLLDQGAKGKATIQSYGAAPGSSPASESILVALKG